MYTNHNLATVNVWTFQKDNHSYHSWGSKQ